MKLKPVRPKKPRTYTRRQCPVCRGQVLPKPLSRTIIDHFDSIGRDICPMSGELYSLTIPIRIPPWSAIGTPARSHCPTTLAGRIRRPVDQRDHLAAKVLWAETGRNELLVTVCESDELEWVVGHISGSVIDNRGRTVVHCMPRMERVRNGFRFSTDAYIVENGLVA